ncbi:MAG: EVE domain-containing protein [Aquificaceae bacterium]|nr:EVE domain-containing protein [Aquificaceae bacterium]MDW8422917.1 EVE domain-containing protein [Aquificaceae bacterium]
MYYLLKTEPFEYSYEDLRREGKTKWDGVKNPLAQKYIASMKEGDVCFIYHTGNIKAVVGLAEVISKPYKDKNGLWVVDIRATERLKRYVFLRDIKECAEFKESPLTKIPRLSVVPLTQNQAERILKLSEHVE